MKKQTVWLCVLLSCVLLFGCAGKPDAGLYDELRDIHAAYAQIQKAEIGFVTEATFRDASGEKTGVLYYLNGEAKYDEPADRAWQSYTATLLGAGVSAVEYYENGLKTHVEAGKTDKQELPSAQLFGAFPYQTVPLPAYETVKVLEKRENGTDTLQYTLQSDADSKALVEKIWGLDLYALAGIHTPDRQKEQYGGATYTLIVQDGALQSIRVALEVRLYEQAGYTPGYTQKDEELCLYLTLNAKITFRKIGADVTVPSLQEGETT